MKIVVVTRCLNEENNIERFLHGYSFADLIIVSDGGSIDDSVKMLNQHKNVKVIHFEESHVSETGIKWNEDNPHLNFVIDAGKEYEPDWLILDDMDCWPNSALRAQARKLFDGIDKECVQVNAFRLYMWGTDEYFPKMNGNFDLNFVSLWGWNPKKLDIYADESVAHGTLLGLSDKHYKILPPMALMHYSWHPDTIDAKLRRYKAMGLEVHHPFDMPNAGKPVALPEWATTE